METDSSAWRPLRSPIEQPSAAMSFTEQWTNRMKDTRPARMWCRSARLYCLRPLSSLAHLGEGPIARRAKTALSTSAIIRRISPPFENWPSTFIHCCPSASLSKAPPVPESAGTTPRPASARLPFASSFNPPLTHTKAGRTSNRFAVNRTLGLEPAMQCGITAEEWLEVQAMTLSVAKNIQRASFTPTAGLCRGREGSRGCPPRRR